MKTILRSLMLLALLAGFTGPAAAQKKPAADSVALLADIHCDDCIAQIERTIPFERGVKEVAIDLAQKKVTVFYDGKKTNPDKILQAFAKIRMDAELYPPRQEEE